MTWQQQTLVEIRTRLPVGAELEVVGSTATPSLLDTWSDLDLQLRLRVPVDLTSLFGEGAIWAAEVSEAAEGQVVRLVLADGRRIDLVVSQGRLPLPALAPDNAVRFLAAVAVVKLGRGDRLIGMHLGLELLRSCLVQAMLLRDRDVGTAVHRTGSPRDALAAEVADLARLPFDLALRPTVVERTVELYGRWREELESDYRADWTGLRAVLGRGMDRGRSPAEP